MSNKKYLRTDVIWTSKVRKFNITLLRAKWNKLILDRQVRISKRCQEEPLNCFLCYTRYEDMDYLFFQYPYSTSILERLYELTGNGLVAPPSERLMDILNKVSGFSKKSLP